MSTNLIDTTFAPSSSPVKAIPDDYVPGGTEYAQWFDLTEGPDTGKKLFFYDVTLGEGRPEQTILFVHGNPECSYTYRRIVSELDSHRDRPIRVVAMDHIGFGLSDQASFEMVDMHHAQNLKQLITHLDLQNISLVIHDWGGPIGVGALIDTPERVTSLTVINTTVFPMPPDGIVYDQFPFPGVLSWNALAHWCPDFIWRFVPPLVVCKEASSTGQFAKLISTHLFQVLFGQLSPTQRMYRDMFSTPMNARSSKRNAMQTDVWAHGYSYDQSGMETQSNHSFYKNIQAKIATVWGARDDFRACAFFGEWDACGKPSVQHQWQAAFPQLKTNTHSYPHRSHFIEEYEFVDIAKGILSLSNPRRP